MVMYANEFETKEKQKLTEIKNKLQHLYGPRKIFIQASLKSELANSIIHYSSLANAKIYVLL